LEATEPACSDSIKSEIKLDNKLRKSLIFVVLCKATFTFFTSQEELPIYTFLISEVFLRNASTA
jgi:hypothetical protein